MRKGDIESIRFLLPKKDPNGFIEDLVTSSQKRDKFEISLFHAAVLEGHHKLIQLLCELGVSIKRYDHVGQTPLHYAANYLYKEKSSYHKTIFELLKFDKASELLMAEDNYRTTPIKYANLSRNNNFFNALREFESFSKDNRSSDLVSMKSR